MIFYDSEKLEVLIEAIYLDEKISNATGKCNIFVNPSGSLDYLVGKVIIINTTNYSESNIKKLLENKNKIISRVFIDNPLISVQPYILRVNFDIMWNGKYTEDLEGYYDYETRKLYMSKPSSICYSTFDNKGNLTYYGWALQQIGINIVNDTKFRDLDIIKTKKILKL